MDEKHEGAGTIGRNGKPARGFVSRDYKRGDDQDAPRIVLKDGQEFWYLVDHREPQHVCLLLDDLHQGLYWSPADEELKRRPDKCFPLNGEFSVSTRSANPSRAWETGFIFSLHLKEPHDKTYSFQTPDLQVRDAWATTLRQIAEKTNSTPVVVRTHIPNGEMRVNPNDIKLKLLRDGALFRYTHPDPSGRFVSNQDIFIWYDPLQGHLGSVCWDSPARSIPKFNKKRRILLSKVQDLYVGLQKGAVPGIAFLDQSCFSITALSSDGDLIKLCLQAEDHDTRDNWVTVLNAIMSADEALMIHVPPPPEPSDKTPLTSLEEMLKQGAIFRGYTTAPKQRQQSSHRDLYALTRHVFLFYDEGNGGVLYWSADGTTNRVKDPSRAIPLASIVDILHGKHTAVLQSVVAANADERCCFSLKTSSKVFNLQAPSVTVCNQWLEGLNQLLTKSGRLLLAVTNAIPDDETQIQLITQGAEFTLWSNPDLPECKRVFVFYRDETSPRLHWCDVNERSVRAVGAPDRCFDLNDLTDVFVGKFTRLFKHPRTHLVPVHLAFSLLAHTEEDAWNLEALTMEQLSAWVSALQIALRRNGKAVEDQGSAGDQRIRVMQKTDRFANGSNFKAYFGTPASPFIRDIRLFYAADDTKLGSLYWSAPPPAPRQQSEDFRLPLDLLKEIILGGDDEIFTSETGPPRTRNDGRLMSLIGADELQELRLEAASEQTVLAWKEFIAQKMKAAGYGVNVLDLTTAFQHPSDVISMKELHRRKMEAEVEAERKARQTAEDLRLKLSSLDSSPGGEISEFKLSEKLTRHFFGAENKAQQEKGILTYVSGSLSVEQEGSTTCTSPSSTDAQSIDALLLGSLSWTSNRGSLDFDMKVLTDIVTGRQRSIWLENQFLDAPKLVSFLSLPSNIPACHVQCDTEEQMSVLLSRVYTLLARHRKVVEVDDNGRICLNHEQSNWSDPEEVQRMLGSQHRRHFRILMPGDPLVFESHNQTLCEFILSDPLPTPSRSALLSPHGGVGDLRSKTNFQTSHKFMGHTVKRGKRYSRDVRIWFDPAVGMGHIYWCAGDASPRAGTPDCRTALEHVQSVVFGHDPAVLSDMPQPPPEENCFSLVCRDHTLTLEASAEDVVSWLHGLHVTILRSGRQIRQIDDRSFVWL